MSREASRLALGVGRPGHGSLEEAVWAGAGWRPVVILGLLAGAALGQVVAVLIAADMGSSLGVTGSDVSNLAWSWVLGAVLCGPLALRLTLGRPRRIPMLVGGGFLLAVGYTGAAMAVNQLTLGLAAALAGAGTTLLAAAWLPLLADLYPSAGRSRVVAAVVAIASLATGVVILLAQLVPAAEPLTWRGGLLLAAAFSTGTALAVGGIAEPDTGAPDADRVARVVWGANGGRPADAASAAPITMGFNEAVRRAYAVATVKPILSCCVLLGAALYAISVFGAYVLGERGGAGTATTAVLLFLGSAGAALGVGVEGPWAAAAFAAAPHRLAWRTRTVVLVSLLPGGLLLVLSDRLGALPAAVGLALAGAGLAVVAVTAATMLAAVLPAALRGVGGLYAAAAVVAGAGLAAQLLPAIDEAYGLAIALLAVPSVAVAILVLMTRAATRADKDFEGAVDSILEAEELAMSAAHGEHVPLLNCRRVCFAYGPLQVLFDVDFTVDDGEMVALLGTNGAGKSTLLKVISGIGTPFSGAVRHQGRDITFMEPAARVKRGITQIPGGKAVFGPLSVAENLRLYGYSLGRDRRAVDRGIEAGFAAFPRLAERRNSPASTMSGGEQQMLALTKALILKPRLLLIDELSLGLAPKVVGELLEMVREINATGTAVVLVEQSVNVALSLARHAYFMEKGTMQFDGATADLLQRPDVLRSVFLRGAAAGLAS